MRVQAAHGDAVRVGQPQERVDLFDRQAELAAAAAGAHFLVMAQATTEIDAQHDLAPAEHVAPMFQRIERIERDRGACASSAHA